MKKVKLFKDSIRPFVQEFWKNLQQGSNEHKSYQYYQKQYFARSTHKDGKRGIISSKDQQSEYNIQIKQQNGISQQDSQQLESSQQSKVGIEVLDISDQGLTHGKNSVQSQNAGVHKVAGVQSKQEIRSNNEQNQQTVSPGKKHGDIVQLATEEQIDVKKPEQNISQTQSTIPFESQYQDQLQNKFMEGNQIIFNEMMEGRSAKNMEGSPRPNLDLDQKEAAENLKRYLADMTWENHRAKETIIQEQGKHSSFLKNLPPIRTRKADLRPPSASRIFPEYLYSQLISNSYLALYHPWQIRWPPQYRIMGKIEGTYEQPSKQTFAIFEHSGKQVKLNPGDVFYSEKYHDIDINDVVTFHRVIMLGSRYQTIVGRPYIPGACVVAACEEQLLDAEQFKMQRKRRHYNNLRFRMKISGFRILDIIGIEEKPAQIKELQPKLKELEREYYERHLAHLEGRHNKNPEMDYSQFSEMPQQVEWSQEQKLQQQQQHQQQDTQQQQ